MSRLPNLISFLRLLLSPLLFYVPQQYVLPLFILLALSDALDGFIARLLKAKTELGKVLDPLADKVLMFCVLLLCTFKLGRLPPYLFYILLLRDLFLILGGLLLLIKTGGVIQAKLAGKLTTLSLSLLIFSCMLGKSMGIMLVVVLTLIFLSWFDYALEGYKRLKSQTSYEL